MCKLMLVSYTVCLLRFRDEPFDLTLQEMLFEENYQLKPRDMMGFHKVIVLVLNKQ